MVKLYFMRKKIKSRTIKQSLIIIITLILINIIGSEWFFRLDLTSEKRYSLSENTKELFANNQDTISIKIFLDGDLNIGFQKLSKATRELLYECKVYGRNRLHIEFIDPQEGTKKEKQEISELFKKLDLHPQTVFEKTEDGRNTRSLVYPYAIVEIKDYQLPINLLENIQGYSGKENLNKSIEELEYKFTDAIRRLTTPERPKIAFLEGQGELDEVDVIDITDELSKYYQVDRGKIGTDPHILDPYKAIIIAKPQKKFSESDKFIIDQYFMHGGKILWLVDAVNITLDSLRQAGATIGLYSDINISDQLFKYGVRINPVLIRDIQCGMIPITVPGKDQQPQITPAPWLFNPLLIPNSQHAISRNMNMIEGEFTSSIDTVNAGLKLKRTVLLETSRYSRTDQVPVYVSLSFVNNKTRREDFTQSHLPVAVIEEGIFPSVFQNRLIPQNIDKSYTKIKQQSSPTQMIVIADGDLIKNKVHNKSSNPQILPLGYDELSNQTFGNKDFITNAVNYLCDDDGWMELRARSYKLRILDRSKISDDSLKWKIINLAIPLALIFLLAICISVIRKIKYSK